MKFDGSITFFSNTTLQVTRAVHTNTSDANASVIVMDKSFRIQVKFCKTDTNCYFISHSFYVKREISTGKKLRIVESSFSDPYFFTEFF